MTLSSKEECSNTRAFTFIELLIVLLFVSLWLSGSLVELKEYLWIFEIVASLAWFVLLYVVLKHILWDYTRKRTFLWNIKPLVVTLFFLHIGIAFFLRFWLQISIINAYPLSFGFCVVVPTLMIPLLLKFQEILGHQNRLTGVKVREIAMQSPTAQEFVQTYPDSTFYVYHHTRNHRIGTCLIQHRNSRQERPALFEDLLLEIFVDLMRCKVIPGKERITHYLFQPYQEGSIVMELPEGDWRNPTVIPDSVLLQFDQIMNTFPSLESYPLPLAVRKVAFEILAA